MNAEESVGGIVLVERKKEPADRRAGDDIIPLRQAGATAMRLELPLFLPA